MIRVEIGNTTIRLFNDVKDASVEANARNERDNLVSSEKGWTVRQLDAGCFVHKDKQFIDSTGEFGRFLDEKQREDLIKASKPRAPI